MTKFAWVVVVAAVLVSSEVCAQENPPQQPPAAAQQTKVENTVKRYRIGVQGGIGLDPEIIDVGVHASFSPIFSPRVAFRPVFELGFGEVTTLLAFNFDLLYTFDDEAVAPSWRPYLGVGPQFGLVHQGFSTEDSENVDAEVGGEDVDETGGRFDFSNTDFNGGLNFIVGMKRRNGTFFEMKTTAWGASNIRLLIGFNF
jgi:hypothetical protein